MSGSVHRRGFFRQVTRYVATPARDPREDRLTQITAAVLERVPGLARALALAWLDPNRGAPEERPADTAEAARVIDELETDAPVRTRTQIQFPGRVVDLEVRFFADASMTSTAALLWVEAKHGTDPHTNQLSAYRDARPGHPGAVVLLAPRRDLPVDRRQCPADVPQRCWESAARVGSTLQRRAASLDKTSGWLLGEWLAYLKEESLMDIDALGPEHMTALVYRREAESGLPALCAAAMRVAEEKLGRHGAQYENVGRSKGPVYGLGYWSTWDLPGDWDGAWFDWMLDESGGGDLGIQKGHVYVQAGLSKPRGGEFSPASWQDGFHAGLRAGAQRAIFRRWRGDHERLKRVAYLHQIVRGDTLDEQGASLGEWLIETYRAIEAYGPPPR